MGDFVIKRDVQIHMDKGEAPRYAHDGDAGFDLRATEEHVIEPHTWQMVGTGLHMALPKGTVGLVFPRSGLGCKGLVLRNGTGVIDSTYRGEVKMPLLNTSDERFVVMNRDRVAQMVVVPYIACDFQEVDELVDSERGADGFGSTGVA